MNHDEIAAAIVAAVEHDEACDPSFAVWNAAIEAAAMACIERANRVGHSALPYSTGEACAASIRALKDKPMTPKSSDSAGAG